MGGFDGVGDRRSFVKGLRRFFVAGSGLESGWKVAIRFSPGLNR
jgi:hypothetical protein